MLFKKYLSGVAFLGLIVVIGCTASKEGIKQITVEVTNNLNFSRKEIVAIPVADLSGLLKSHKESSIRVKKSDGTDYERTQWIDNDMDGKMDELLFQAEVEAGKTAVYQVVADSTVALPETDVVAYSRFVPERTDDYTWENDKVAFRTYGPDAQQRTEQGRENGTLSSGIDLWLKRTDKSIINKWYKGYQTDPMFYHRDKGEGYDPYHVGKSRGTGGIGVWVNDSLQVSKNFTSYKTIASGPLRTVFELTYAPWSEYEVTETKRISLDLGSNFCKFVINLNAQKRVPNYTIGLTLHEKKGDAKVEAKEGWVRHWEQIDDAYVGEGIVVNPKIIDTAFARISEIADMSNILIVTKPADELSYYVGFAWQKSGQVATEADWDALIVKEKQIIENPLKVNISK